MAYGWICVKETRSWKAFPKIWGKNLEQTFSLMIFGAIQLFEGKDSPLVKCKRPISFPPVMVEKGWHQVIFSQPSRVAHQVDFSYLTCKDTVDG